MNTQLLSKFKMLPLLSGLIFLSGLHTPISKADDTDVYITAGAGANVLFIFDQSGSMNSGVNGTNKTRYEVMTDAITNVLNSIKDKENLKVGLSMFGIGNDATGVLWPITGINQDANSVDSAINVNQYKTFEIIPKILSDRNPQSNTPIVVALHEAALYFTGGKPSDGMGGREPKSWSYDSGSEGRFSGGDDRGAHPRSYTPTNAWSGSSFSTSAKYVSPITDSCTKNYIVLLTDGEANAGSSNTRSKIESMIGDTCSGSDEKQKCGPELVSWLANTDVMSGSGIVPSKVITHTIGFAAGSGNTFMKELAEAGGGDFYDADDAADLEAVFETILTAIASETQTFTGISTSVNSSTLSSDERVFINMFKPDTYRSWIGNTKGYYIGDTGMIDLNGNDAVEVVGTDVEFKATAQSFWSASPDGNNIAQGGASNKLNPANRSILTYTGNTPPANTPLTLMSDSEPSITKEMFDVTTNTEKNELIDWLKNAPMGDTMHANSVLVKYADKDVLFTMTNQGLMHAINVSNPTTQGDMAGGNEIAAFIPQSLLKNVQYHKDNQTGADHLYGLDGSLTHWHDDSNRDGVVDSGESVYLYFGMRRGGDQYFALDVSSLSGIPNFLWRIDGDSADFAKLDQSWSRPIVATVKWRGNPTKVLIFSGGYNIAQDGYTTRTTDTSGNAIFMVDASTGALLWSASNDGTATANYLPLAQMTYSIPTDLSIIDAYGDDDLADRIYFGDMGGQVWRIDFTDTFGTSASGAVGYRLADLADGTTAGFRRFYMPPSISLINDQGHLYYSVAIGSGARANPLNKAVNDNFYMLKDNNMNHGTTSSTVSMPNLYNATANLIGQGSASDQTSAKASLEASSGWYIELEGNGEKAISPALVWNNMIAFTTYTPVSTSGLSCNSSAGQGRLYLLSTMDATPAIEQTNDTTLNKQDRSTSVPGVGIPTSPIAFFPKGKSQLDLYVGHERALTIDNPVVKINWKVIQ